MALPSPAATEPCSVTPDAALVHHQAGVIRELRLRAALQALGQLQPLSDPDQLLSASEVEVRLFAHDLTHAHHDKDVRSLGACRPGARGPRLVRLGY